MRARNPTRKALVIEESKESSQISESSSSNYSSESSQEALIFLVEKDQEESSTKSETPSTDNKVSKLIRRQERVQSHDEALEISRTLVLNSECFMADEEDVTSTSSLNFTSICSRNHRDTFFSFTEQV